MMFSFYAQSRPATEAADCSTWREVKEEERKKQEPKPLTPKKNPYFCALI